MSVTNQTNLEKTSEENLKEVKNRVAMAQNPHPLPIIIGTMFAMLLIYMIFLIWIASSISGTWIDSAKNRYMVEGSRLFGSVSIYEITNGGPSLLFSGNLKGHRLSLIDRRGQPAEEQGAWIDNQILWINKRGDVKIWDREINIM